MAVSRTWTTEQAVSLAPDAGALKSAQGLASPRKWLELGSDGDFVWGLAQGSGANPYQVRIDLAEPAFKCSCPSRKFPCKHALGLLLLRAAQPGAIPQAAQPAWVTEWVGKRAERTAKQEAKTVEAAESLPDIAAQAKRRAKRESNIAEGITFLEGWLQDLARQGVAAAAAGGYGQWDGVARRMVDAQAPGLARRVRALGDAVASSHGGEERMVAELGRLYLLLAANRRRAELPASWQAEIDTQLGWTVDQEELRQNEGLRGTWFVGAQTVAEEQRLVTRTSYLFSTAGQAARFLEFHHASQPVVTTLAAGRWVEGEVVAFPGVQSTRVLWKSTPRDAAPGTLPVVTRCDVLLSSFAERVALNPFTEPLPAIVRLEPQRQRERWWLRDDSGAALPLVDGFTAGWELLACAGGRALDVVGTWDGFAFTPLAALADGTLWALGGDRDSA